MTPHSDYICNLAAKACDLYCGSGFTREDYALSDYDWLVFEACIALGNFKLACATDSEE